MRNKHELYFWNRLGMEFLKERQDLGIRRGNIVFPGRGVVQMLPRKSFCVLDAGTAR